MNYVTILLLQALAQSEKQGLVDTFKWRAGAPKMESWCAPVLHFRRTSFPFEAYQLASTYQYRLGGQLGWAWAGRGGVAWAGLV